MKITGILITRGRQEMAAKALACFLAQDYPDKQLIILDDALDRSFPDGVDHPLVRYEMSGDRMIATKRNMAAAMADGDVLAHFDSDDWSSPERLTVQAKMMTDSGKAVCGFCSMLFFEPATNLAAKYVNRGFAIGTSLMYTRAYWQSHPFRENPSSPPNIGEDTGFTKTARDAGELVWADAEQIMVALVHPGNTSPKSPKMRDTKQNEYRPVPLSAIPEAFFR